MILSFVPACGNKDEGEDEPKMAQDSINGKNFASMGAAPEFTLTDINGKKVASSSLKGKVVLLHFWATWCYFCRLEVTPLNELYRDYKDRGVVILAVSMDDEPEAVKAFQQKMPMHYQVVMGDMNLADSFGKVRGLPNTFLITPQWQIYRQHQGYVPKAVIEKDLKDMISKKS